MRGETDLSALQAALRNTGMAINLYADPANRAGYRATWAAELRQRLTSADAGGDLQLAFLRAFAAAAHTEEHGQFLASVLDGNATIDGLEVDTELRWFLIGRLAGLGVIDGERIDAELSRDDTSNGREAAAVARAAIPTAQAKEYAYAQVLNPDVSNAMTRSYMAGFWDIDRPDVLQPYVERYFSDLPSVWPTKGEDLAEDIGVLMFPMQFVSDALLDRTDRFLAENPSLTKGAQRLTRENRDAAVRALRCRAKDAN
jgi:aminopeptidase N